MTITMVHFNPVHIAGNTLKLDRKFHVGMLNYVGHIPHPITTINPKWRPGQAIMDAIEVPLSELPYSVMAVDDVPGHLHAQPHEHEQLRQQIGRSRLVYGTGLSSAPIAQSLEIPYIQILENDLRTQLKILAADTADLGRRLIRSARCARDYGLISIPEMRRAHSLHCNGYPIYDATRKYNSNQLLFLDSRMSAEQVIDAGALQSRLKAARSRPLRLIYSGRYEKLKGADDAVRVAVGCLQLGLEIEMDCYGQGRLKTDMEAIAAGRAQIRVHDAVSYPDLVKAAQGADVFICCHIQDDPSCTYLESMGAGLPIVGYANRMWKRLRDESQAGFSSPIRQVSDVVNSITQLLADDRKRLIEMSVNARAFALNHCFEREFEKRVDAINAVVTQQ